MSLHCISLRFQPAMAASLGVNYTFSLATAPGPIAEGNGELAPLFDASLPSHGCRFRLQSEIYPEPIVGFFLLDVPWGNDANRNGVNDFFEVQQPVDPVGSQGIFVDDVTQEQGKVSAIWSRMTNSTTGTCQLRLESSYLYLTFPHTFELLQYTGRLQYSDSQLWLTIQGEVGFRHTVEQNSLLGPTNWLPLLSVDLTNSPQTILLPEPVNRTSFYRVRAP